MRGILLIIILCCVSLADAVATVTEDQEHIIESLGKMSEQELMSRGTEYADNQHYDTAFLYYNTVINKPVTKNNCAVMVKAMNRAAALYGRISDYRSAFNMLIRALSICDRYNLTEERSSIYNNIGNIYYSFGKYNLASDYYKKALVTNRDSSNTFSILNNLVNLSIKSGRTDSLQYWLGKCDEVNKREGGRHTHLILNSLAYMYQQEAAYDSAFCYYRLSLAESRKSACKVTEASVLSSMADLWLTRHVTDSARKYVKLSSDIARKNNLRTILADNMMLLARIEEAEGNLPAALTHFKHHYALRDSIMDASLFGEITDMQSIYETSKINRRIEQMEMERRIKERTIGYQRTLMSVGALVLLLAMGFLFFITASKRKLNRAYNVLMKKNIEIMELEEQERKAPEAVSETRKSQDAVWPQDMPEKIKTVMEDDSQICDPKFSIGRLSELVGTNRTYVSSFINSVEGKNFRSFLNEYRIRAAQRIFAHPDAAKYTIETVAAMVGFKSQSSFRDAFKDITGVTPGFYVKSLKSTHSV